MMRAAVFVFLSIIAIARPATAQTPLPAECQPVLDAGEKQFTVPSHSVMTTSGLGPAPMQTETIHANGTVYVKVQDRWRVGPLTPAQMIAQAKSQMSKAKSNTCKQLPDDTVDGAPAHVYTSHSESANGGTDTQVWVAKSTGLPLKSEIDINLGGRKTHVSVKYDYNNVTAPTVN
jgi:hypothetical protein